MLDFLDFFAFLAVLSIPPATAGWAAPDAALRVVIQPLRKMRDLGHITVPASAVRSVPGRSP
jgi:hypothetical protein